MVISTWARACIGIRRYSEFHMPVFSHLDSSFRAFHCSKIHRWLLYLLLQAWVTSVYSLATLCGNHSDVRAISCKFIWIDYTEDLFLQATLSLWSKCSKTFSTIWFSMSPYQIKLFLVSTWTSPVRDVTCRIILPFWPYNLRATPS